MTDRRLDDGFRGRHGKTRHNRDAGRSSPTRQTTAPRGEPERRVLRHQRQLLEVCRCSAFASPTSTSPSISTPSLASFVDPEEYAPELSASGLVHQGGLRIYLIFNGVSGGEGNILLDVSVKRPGYTHAAFIIDRMDEFVSWLGREGHPDQRRPVTMGLGRRKVCFIRDPDLNVLEFNEILR